MKEIFLLFGNKKERFHFAILYSIEAKTLSRLPPIYMPYIYHYQKSIHPS